LVINHYFSTSNSEANLLYTLLIGKSKSINKDIDEKLISNIPLDMLQYKFLMHPTRLAIMKLLFTYDRLSSIEIKSTLQISWSEYQTHIRALQTKLLIKVSDDFDNGSLKQFVYLEPQGRTEYQNLLFMLEEFVKPDSQGISEFVIEDPVSENSEGNLYPKN
jgi:hypothetical protein